MCYNVSTKKISKETEKQFKSKIDTSIILPSHYYLSGFTHPLVPVISAKQPDLITAFNWCLIPDFCKTEKEANRYAGKNFECKKRNGFHLAFI